MKMQNQKTFLKLFLLLAVLGLGVLQNVLAAGELTVTKVTRITHPAYDMQNLWQGEGFGNDNGGSGLWNKDYTRIIMYEGWTTQAGFENGRGLVWGDLNALKNFGQEFVVTSGTVKASSAYKGTLADYQNNTHNIPDGFAPAPVWSIFNGEENIMYAVCDDEIAQPWRCGSLQNHLVKYDTDSGIYTDVADLGCTGSCSGQSVVIPQIAGWTTDNTLVVLFKGADNWGAGWEINPVTKTKTYFTGRPEFCTADGHKWPFAKIIHIGRSPDKFYISNYDDGAYVQSNDYANEVCAQTALSSSVSTGSKIVTVSNTAAVAVGKYVKVCSGGGECEDWKKIINVAGNTLTLENAIEISRAAGSSVYVSMIWLDSFGAENYYAHCMWSWNNDWYLCSANGYNHKYHTVPYITAGTFEGDRQKDYAIFQVFFDRATHKFTHNFLLSQSTAGYWCPTGNCGEQDENYHGLMTPTLRNDGQQIMYLGTGGVYSLEDYSLRGVTPYGAQGMFLADLAPATGSDTTPPLPPSGISVQ